MNVAKALTQWSVQEVGEWIERICLFNDLKNYKHNFVNHQVDGSLLSQLKVKDLEEALGIPNKDAKTLEQHIQHLAKFIESVHRASDLQTQLGDVYSTSTNILNDARNEQSQMSFFDVMGKEWISEVPISQDHNNHSLLDNTSQSFVYNSALSELLGHNSLHLVCLFCGKVFTSETDDQIKEHVIEHTQHPATVTLCPSSQLITSELCVSPRSKVIDNILQMNTHSTSAVTNNRNHHSNDSIPSSSNSTTHHSFKESQTLTTSATVTLKSSRRSSKTSKNLEISITDRKWHCDFTGCGKAFKRLGHLKRHQVVHKAVHERERFPCSEPGCTKNYSTKYDLAAHIRQVHKGMKPFKCSVKGCCRRFVKRESLEKHIQTFDHSRLQSWRLHELSLGLNPSLLTTLKPPIVYPSFLPITQLNALSYPMLQSVVLPHSRLDSNSTTNNNVSLLHTSQLNNINNNNNNNNNNNTTTSNSSITTILPNEIVIVRNTEQSLTIQHTDHNQSLLETQTKNGTDLPQ